MHCGRPRRLCGLSEAYLFSSYGLPKATCQATLGIFARLQRPPGTFGLVSLVRRRSLESRCMSLSRPFENAVCQPAKASRHLWPNLAPQLCLVEPVHYGRPRPLCGLSKAYLFSSHELPKATWQATLGILVRFQRPPDTFGLIRHRSLAWQSRCMSLPGPFESAVYQPSIQRPPGTFGLVLHRFAWQSRCIVAGRGLSAACPRPVSSLFMGFRRRRARRR